MGDDVVYSGTVAAATEGFLLGIPSIAISLCEKEGHFFDTAAAVVQDLLRRHLRSAAGPWLMNVNVPNVPFSSLKGFQITRLGRRHKAESMIPMESPRGGTVYWLGAAGAAADAGEGTDFHAVDHNFVSITPLRTDLTHHDAMSDVANWFTK
jgi:Predicted acid phosphatase